MKFLLALIFGFSIQVSADSFMSRNLSAEFKQQIKSKLSGRTIESELKMDYSYPGKFSVKANGKNNFIFVSNGTTSWYYRPPFIRGELGEVTIREVSHLKFLRVFDALYKGAKTEGYFSVKKSEKRREFVFTEKIQKEIGTQKVIFLSDKKINTIFDAKKINIYKAKNSITTLIVEKIKKVSSFSKNHFEFKVPKKTKIIKD